MTGLGRVVLRLGIISMLLGSMAMPRAILAADLSDSDPFIVATDQASHYADFDTLVDRLRTHFKAENFPPVQMVLMPSIDDLFSLIDDGAVDLVLSDGRTAIRAMDRNPMTITLKSNQPSQNIAETVFAVRKDSDIKQLEDLSGRTLTFEGVWNRSGYYAPITHLQRAGLPLRFQSGVREVSEADVVNFLFAGDELNMVAWLDHGLVDALAFNRTDWDNDAETPPHIREQLRLIVDDEVVLDQYLTLASPRAIRKARWIDQLLQGEGQDDQFSQLEATDYARLRFLTETLKQTEGHPLAHE